MGALRHSGRQLIPVAAIVMKSAYCASPKANTAVGSSQLVILYPAMNGLGYSSAHLQRQRMLENKETSDLKNNLRTY